MEKNDLHLPQHTTRCAGLMVATLHGRRSSNLRLGHTNRRRYLTVHVFVLVLLEDATGSVFVEEQRIALLHVFDQHLGGLASATHQIGSSDQLDGVSEMSDLDDINWVLLFNI